MSFLWNGLKEVPPTQFEGKLSSLEEIYVSVLSPRSPTQEKKITKRLSMFLQ